MIDITFFRLQRSALRARQQRKPERSPVSTSSGIINEPRATSVIAYGLNEKKGESQITVYDLGGGTFDVPVLSVDNGVFEVLENTRRRDGPLDQRL